MSATLVRAALETALAAMSPSVTTAWENTNFTPPADDTPYQRVSVLFADPENLEMSKSWTERGFMQVTLCYPNGKGAGPALTRAQLVRDTFFRGRTVSSGGINVLISGTPSILPALNDGGRFVLPVRIPFRANINPA